MYNFFKSSRYSEKVFCIGFNKTGTTSVERAFRDLGYKVGNQRKGENLIDEWAKRDFRKIIKFAKTADAFQDVPFSLPFTYQALDSYFPNSKFILTVRDNSEQWYESLIRFHGKIWGKNGRTPPTAEDLKLANYIYKGRPFITNQLIYNTPEFEPYKKDTLISLYNDHIKSVKNYFLHRDNIIIINVSIKKDYYRLCSFLDKKPMSDSFPHLNKT